MPIQEIDEITIRKRVESYFSDRNDVFIHAAIFAVVNLGAMVLLLNAEGGWPWPLLLLLAWGAGLAGHVIDVGGRSPRRLAQADHSALEQMAHIYGPDWQETASEEDYQRIYKRAHQALNQKKEFLIHAAAYVGISLASWFFWTGVVGGNPLIPLLFAVGWGIGLVGHGISIYGGTSHAANRRERAIQQAVEREQDWLYAASSGGGKAKRKREPDMQRLMRTDEGDVLEIDEEDWQEEDPAQHLNMRT